MPPKKFYIILYFFPLYESLTLTLQKFTFIYLNENPLKMIKMLFFHVKRSFFFNIFTFLYWLFGYLEKRLDKEALINFKIYDVSDWTKNNYNTNITQHLKE